MIFISRSDVDGHVASDEFLRRPRQRMCPAGSGFGQFERWEWIWTLLKRSRCTVSFPLLYIERIVNFVFEKIGSALFLESGSFSLSLSQKSTKIKKSQESQHLSEKSQL